MASSCGGLEPEKCAKLYCNKDIFSATGYVSSRLSGENGVSCWY